MPLVLVPRRDRCASSPAGLHVLSNMQWFYGPTWGSTLRRCEQLGARQRLGGCTNPEEFRARQLELVEVLRRNVVNAAVTEVHVLVGEAEPLRRFLSHLPWFERLGCKVHLVETGTRPRFSDYMRHLSGPLRGRTVAFVNQDVFLEGARWESVPRTLGRGEAYFLSRYHTREQYDVQHSLAAGAAEGLFNASLAVAVASSPSALSLTRSFVTPKGQQREKRMCDMTASRFAVWRRSLCSSANFGSFDAYVLRLERALTAAEIDLFDYPQNAWGGENLFLYLVQRALGMAASNPCLSLRAVHMHCELATAFGVQKVGDRRLGKREIIERARSKLQAMGHTAVAAGAHVKIGEMRLNVTTLPRGPTLAHGDNRLL